MSLCFDGLVAMSMNLIGCTFILLPQSLIVGPFFVVFVIPQRMSLLKSQWQKLVILLFYPFLFKFFIVKKKQSQNIMMMSPFLLKGNKEKSKYTKRKDDVLLIS